MVFDVLPAIRRNVFATICRSSLRAFVSLMALCLFAPAAFALASPVCDANAAKGIPARPADALTGSGFAASVAALDERAREGAILREVLRGNVPNFLRALQPVTLTSRVPGRGWVEITVCVTPDYLAIGDDEDFLRVPVNLLTAQHLAARLDFILPTRKLVDVIYHQSTFHLRPSPMRPGPEMRSTDYYVKHNRTITRQRLAAGGRLGALTAGHKKDLVLTNRLIKKPGRVAIYGWHHLDGQPIQPLSTVHGARYADYSHGLRLVANTVTVNGQRYSMAAVLQDPDLVKVLSDEGPLMTSLTRL